jgi:hypothetical protein
MRWMLLFLFPAMVMVGASSAMAQQRTPNPAVKAACRGDAQRLCAGVQPGGGRIGQCLKARMHEVSPQCLEAVRASKAGAPPR